MPAPILHSGRRFTNSPPSRQEELVLPIEAIERDKENRQGSASSQQ
jgi:hypothetical protein